MSGGQVEAPFPVVVCGYELTRPLPTRRPTGLSFTLVRDGALSNVAPSRVIRLRRHQLIVCNSGECFTQVPEGLASVVTLTVDEAFLTGMPWLPARPGLARVLSARIAGRLPMVVSLRADHAIAISTAMNHLEAARRHADHGWLQAVGHLVVVLSELDTAIDAACARAIQSPRNPAVRAATDLMDADPAHAWTLNELADRIYLSKSQLVRVFRAQLGMTPMDYVREARLQAMATALLSTAASISAVARAAGWSSPHHATALFRQRFGLTPAEYRLSAIAQR